MNQYETKPWVLVSNLRDDTKSVDLEMLACSRKLQEFDKNPKGGAGIV